MKTFLSLCAGAAFCILASCSEGPTKQMPYNQGINVIPTPVSLVQNEGSFKLSKNTAFSASTPEAKTVAEYFAAQMNLATGYQITVSDKAASNGIALAIDEALDVNDEGYTLAVTPQGVTVKAKTPQGLFYGMQTFMQLLPAEIQSPAVVNGIAWTASCVTVKDEPRFEYRGIMLDPCRHFIPVENVKKHLDVLALFKINRMHWHLTDDQGWRIEIKKYPKLTEVGSKRIDGEGTEYSGFYTQDQIKEVVKYAADRFITIVPEIELPGHELAAISAYPELSCKGEPTTPRIIWGVEDIVLCAGKEKPFELLQDVFDEVAPLFPGEYIHIGGDECPKSSWKECPLCQKRIRKEGLKADKNHSAEEKLQSYFVQRMEKYLSEKHGKKIIGWDEILEGGLAPNATVMSWRGEKGGIEAAKQKHDVIMTPNTYLYFDYYQAKDVDNEPFGIGGYLPLERVYSYEPMPASLTPEEQKYIKGVQANLWTEYIATFPHAQYMVLPRWAALCEIQWSSPEKKNYADFLSRLPQLIKWYDAEGYNYAKHAFGVQAEFEPNPAEGTMDVTLSTIDNAPVHYTLDGTEPTTASPIYEGVLKIKENATLSAKAIRPTGESQTLTEKIDFSKSSMKPIVANQPINEQYLFKGASTLNDGLKGNSSYRSGRWIAFNGNDMDMTIDLQQPTEISSVAISVNVAKGDWVFDARNLSVEVSDDGKTFKKIASEEYPAMKETDKDGVVDHQLTFAPVTTQYVRVIASPEKMLPEWHGGKGKNAFLFVDEIKID